jgi:hypothetical protein
MKFDPDSRSLRFGSAEELERFHRELSDLVRRATVAVSSTEKDAEAARARSQEVLRAFGVVIRALNALRAHLPRRAG